MKKTIILAVSILFAINFNVKAQNTELPLRFNRYYTYEEINQAVKALNREYPELTSTQLVGKSDEGREIWALTINNPKTGKELDKPGVYIDGNIHGNEIQSSEVCLYLAQYLLSNYEKIDRIKKVVDRNVYYIVPSVNVDGRHHFMSGAANPHSYRGLMRPKDTDRDGLYDEDPPNDLNGDGYITQMRKKDPYGKYKTDPEEARLMIRIKPGEQGEWTLLGYEGTDTDGDGKINEDGVGFVDTNRNWPHNWQPQYLQRGAGAYPLSGEGLRALSKYILDRPNIILTYAFHNYGAMFLRGPSSEQLGPMHPEDIKIYDFLGHKAEKIVPGYRYLISWKDLYATHGDFGDFMESIIGSYTFIGELYNPAVESFRKDISKRPTSRQDRERERLKFNDHLTHGVLFKEWEPFNHPQYGEIEIGGWVKYSTRMPHPFLLNDEAHRNAAAVIFAAEHTPEVEMTIFENESIGRNLHRIRVRLHNKNAIPTMSHKSESTKLYPQDILQVKGATVVAGGLIHDPYLNVVSYKEHKPSILFFRIDGTSTKEAEFIVEGKGKITIEYQSRKAGKIEKELSL